MKAQIATSRTEAFNRTELFVVIGILFLLVVMLWGFLSGIHHLDADIKCVNNLHEIGAAFISWERSHDGKYPMQRYATNAFGIRLMNGGNAYLLWQAMSNELRTPKVLHCPKNAQRTEANNFVAGFSDANISYFFNLDTLDDTHPQMILDGDDNLAVDGVRVKLGTLNLPTSNSLTWTRERHRGGGYIGMADGSVMQTTPATLNAAIINATNGTPVTTYRWVIP